MSGLEADVQAVADNGGTFQSKLADTLKGLLGANNERKSEIDSLRSDHETLKKNHEDFVVSSERENDLRRNEVKSLEERMMKENQVRSKKHKTTFFICIGSKSIFNSKTKLNIKNNNEEIVGFFCSGSCHGYCQIGRQTGFREWCT
jgi:hypothetical protein